jgi:hypothetical protein
VGITRTPGGHDLAAVTGIGESTRSGSSLITAGVVVQCSWRRMRLVMVMEYVEGVTLAARLEQGPILAADAVNYMDQLLGALNATSVPPT